MLVVVFGALLAASLPLLLAIVSIAVALGLTAFVAAQWELALFVTNMLIAMGLALGIDYALWSPWSQSAAISANRSARNRPRPCIGLLPGKTSARLHAYYTGPTGW